MQVFSEGGTGLLVSPRRILQVSQTHIGVETKRIERDRLLIEFDCLVKIAQYAEEVRTAAEDFVTTRLQNLRFRDEGVSGIPIPTVEQLRCGECQVG